MNLPFFIARRYLTSQKGTFSSLTLLAIVATGLSVGIMIISMAVVTGFQKTIKEKLFSFTGHIHIAPFNTAKTTTLTEAPIAVDKKMMAKLLQYPHVSQVTAFTERPVILQHNGTMEGVELKGVDEKYRFSNLIDIQGQKINYSDSSYSHEIMLSQTTANKLNIKAGDSLYIQFFNNNSAPRIRKVKVAGLFHSGLEEVDQFYAVCDTRLLQHINLWTPDSINAYQVDLDNEQLADSISNYIHYELISPPLESYTTVENYQAVFDWLDLQSLNGKILLFIMSVVAIINLGTILLILIVDRTTMIGLLKTLGMPASGITKIFLSLGGIISLLGIALGNVIGITICTLQKIYHFLPLPEETYFMKYVPINLVWWHIALIDLGSFVVFIIFIWLPSLYILKIQPSKVLQFK